MRSRTAAIIVAVVIPVLALVGFVLVRGNDSKHTPAKLPVAFGARGSTTTTADAALYPYPGVVYKAGPGLPTLDGTGRAYEITTDVTKEMASRLADAFGMHGEVTTGPDGGFVVTDGDIVLNVSGGAGAWSYLRDTSGGGVASSSPACPPGADCPAPDTTIPQPPADLPSQDEARQIALDTLKRAGMDVDHVEVNIDDFVTQWGVRVDPVIDGVATQGIGASVTIGDHGVIEYANGALGTAHAVDEYPLIGTAKAIENLNAGKGFGVAVPLATPAIAQDTSSTNVIGGGDVVAPDAGSGSGSGSGVASGSPGSEVPVPTAPADTPTTGTLQPQEVVLIDATRVLIATPTFDGTDVFLVPGYRFRTETGDGPSAVAIDESFFAPPAGASSSPDVTIEPQPAPEPAPQPKNPAPDESGPVTTGG